MLLPGANCTSGVSRHTASTWEFGWGVSGMFWVVEKETCLSSAGRMPDFLLLKEPDVGFLEES